MAFAKRDGAHSHTAPGAVDLSAKELRFGRIDSDGEMVVSAGDEIVGGVIIEGKAAGLHSTLSFGPIEKVIAGAAVASGVRVKSDSEGRAITGTANSPGVALTAAAAAGEVISVQFD